MTPISDQRILRILLLEDTLLDVELIEAELENGGFSYLLHRVDTEASFLDALSTFLPNIVLSDYNLPAYDGYSALKKSKQILPETPFILVTGAVGDELAVACMQAGADDYVLKSHLTRLCPAMKIALEKAHTKQALKESEAQYRRIVETANEGIWLIDGAMKTTYVNQKMADMLGTTIEEMIGKNLLEFIDSYEKDAALQVTGQWKQAQAEQYDIKFKRTDGSSLWALVSTKSITDQAGKYAGALAMVTDITGRKQTEQEILEHQNQLKALTARLHEIREEERTAISREIHDELGQSLTAMKIDLSWLLTKLPQNDQTLHRRTEEVIELIDSVIKIVQRISSDLRPGLLDDLGLAAAIEWQAKEYSDRFGIPCTIQKLDDIIEITKSQSTALFRIFQETMTNIARHANATGVTIRLIHNVEGIHLEIEDDGIGITDSQIYASSSIGIIGMKERAESLGGKFTIERLEQKGTRVTVWF